MCRQANKSCTSKLNGPCEHLHPTMISDCYCCALSLYPLASSSPGWLCACLCMCEHCHCTCIVPDILTKPASLEPNATPTGGRACSCKCSRYDRFSIGLLLVASARSGACHSHHKCIHTRARTPPATTAYPKSLAWLVSSKIFSSRLPSLFQSLPWPFSLSSLNWWRRK